MNHISKHIAATRLWTKHASNAACEGLAIFMPIMIMLLASCLEHCLLRRSWKVQFWAELKGDVFETSICPSEKVYKKRHQTKHRPHTQ